MPKCYSYIRFSRPEQMRGDSLRRQKEAADKWAAENGMVIDESLTDLGVSAYRGLNRIKGNLGKFLDLVGKGQVPKGSYLIIESLDRFSREDALDVISEFSKVLRAGITIVTLMDGQVYSRERIKAEPMALFGSLMVMMRAHEESKTKAKRLSDAWEAKRRKAADAVVTARLPGWLQIVEEGGKRRIEFREHGRETVRRIFDETVRGYGKRLIAHGLRKDGVETFGSGGKWHESYVQKILRSRATFGEMQPYRRDDEGRRVPAGPPVKGYYPAAVTETEFLNAAAASELRNKSGGRPVVTGEENLLRGLAFCICGSSMKRDNKGAREATYLVCAESGRGDCSNRRRWRLDFVEGKLLGRTSRINFRKLLAEAGEEGGAPPTVADVEAKVADVRRRLANIVEMVEQGVVEYRERSLALAAELKAAEAELSHIRRLGAMGAHLRTPAQRRRTMAELEDRLRSATPKERADLRTRLAQEVRAAFKRVTFWPDRIEATYKGLVQFGKVMLPRDVTVLVHTENPDEIDDLHTMALEIEENNRRGGSVEEFKRLLQAQRDRTAVKAVDTTDQGSITEPLPVPGV